MRKWVRRAVRARHGAPPVPFVTWPALIRATALHMRLRERRRREFWRRAVDLAAAGNLIEIRDWEDWCRNGPSGSALDGLRAMAHA